MAYIEKATRGYYLVENYRDNGKVRHKRLYIGQRQPWPRSQGWSALASQQVSNLKRRMERRRQNRLPLVAPPPGQYRTIVIDPPWPMAKSERVVAPNQVRELDYPTMTVEEIRKSVRLSRLAFEEGCHVYLWTTQRFLPDAFDLFKQWSVKYECLLTWRKNVGFTPFSFMYTTEHVLFGRIGNLRVQVCGKRLDFATRVNGHSRKPKKFYDLVRQVSPAPRLDMFSREAHKGFEVWGNEVDKFAVGLKHKLNSFEAIEHEGRSSYE